MFVDSDLNINNIISRLKIIDKFKKICTQLKFVKIPKLLGFMVKILGFAHKIKVFVKRVLENYRLTSHVQVLGCQL